MSKRLADALNTALNADTPGTVNAEDIYPTVPVPFKRRTEANPEQIKALETQIAGYQAQLKQAIVRTDGGIQIAGCIGNAAGLLVPDDISAEDMHLLADVLFDFEERIQLFIGDMLNAVERLGYGDIKKIAEAYGRDEYTLYNWKSVCKAVKTSSRGEVLAQHPEKRPLSFTHYRSVAAMTDDQQLYWLNQAMANEWSVQELRDAIKGKALLAATEPTEILDKAMHNMYALFQKVAPSQKREMIQHLRTWLDELERQLPE